MGVGIGRSSLIHDVVGIPDPLRRARVPKDIESVTTIASEDDPQDVGMTVDGVESIWGAVARLYRTGIHPAISICIRRKGSVVLDRSIGHARGNGPDDPKDAEQVLATPDTPFGIFSASKGTSATVIHKLDELGLLHVNDRVAEYLPRFAENGKGSVTIAHVLAHQAGIPILPKEAFDLERIGDWEYQRELMYAAKPASRAGTRQAYHAVSGGAVLGEVVREVTGKDMRKVAAEQLLDPLGFRWMNFGVAPADVDKVALNYPTGPPPVPPLGKFLTRALGGIHPDEATRMSNDPRFMTSVLPSASGYSTANELSRFYEMLRCGGELDGVRVMEARTLRRARIAQSYRRLDESLGLPISFSHGYMLGDKLVSLFGPATPKAFGHLGWINILGWADPQREISVGFLNTGKSAIYPEIHRWFEVMRTISREAAPVE